MRKVYPKDVRFLLADAVRQEQGGKLSLLGFYPGNLVILQGELPKDLRENELFGIPSLGLVFLIMDGQGDFKARIDIQQPNGKRVGLGAALDTKKKSGVTHTITVPLTPFPIDALGTFKVSITFDGRAHHFAFVVRHSDPKATLPPRRAEPLSTSTSRAGKKSTKGRRSVVRAETLA